MKTNSHLEPNQSQKLLLLAAFSPPQDGIRHWDEWKKTNNLTYMDQGSFRLLPLIYQNLKDEHQGDRLFVNLKEIYIETWQMNERLIHAFLKTQALFEEHGIQVVALKGLPYIQRYYLDAGLRRMGDIDMLLRPESYVAGCNLLKDEGWRPNYKDIPFEESKRLFHAIDFISPNKLHLDLHWQIYQGVNQTESFWEGAEELQVKGKPVLALSVADELFHILIHGARWNRVPAIRWIPDAMYLLQNTQALNWDRLIQRAQEHQYSLHVHETLWILKERFSLDIPKEVLRELEEIPRSAVEKIDYRMTVQPFPIIWDMLNKLFYLRRMTTPIKVRTFFRDFRKFLRYTWELEAGQRLVWFVVSVFFKRVWLDVFTKPYFKRKEESVV